MGCEGKTIAMPQQRVDKFPAIRKFPCVERHGFVWVWPGEAALADVALVPHQAWANDPAWAYGGGPYYVQADYRLIGDLRM